MEDLGDCKVHLINGEGLYQVGGVGLRRTRVVGVFPNEGSALDLATPVLVRASEDWALRRYMDMKRLKGVPF